MNSKYFRPRFNLLRYFSLSSLIACVIVAAVFARFIESQRIMLASMISALSVLYVLLFLIARHAQRIADLQSMELLKLSQAVEQSPDGVMLTDLQGRIEYVNARYAEMTGYTHDEMIGKTPRILKSGRQPDALYRELTAHPLVKVVL